MEDLELIGVEREHLELTAPDGSRYRLAIDDRLRNAVRRSEQPSTPLPRDLGPKEIQAHIRGGMTAEEVAAATGAPLEYIRRFEGPVVAEREFVVSSALAVPVHTASAEPLETPSTFGEAIVERLGIIGGVDERWSSWKEAGGWVVKLGYEIGVVEHDARWQFDPKRQSLSPINAEAVGLSRVDAEPESIVPRLRAVISEPEAPGKRSERFDSDAFHLGDLADSGPVLAPLGNRPRGEAEAPAHNQTADLLEALRRRRGEREAAAPEDADELRPSGIGTTMRLVELDIDVAEDAPAPAPAQHPGGLGRKKGRPSLPSWDEIVFGARPDDDFDDLA